MTFDPAATQDLYSNTIEARIFDALYQWDYLARPYRFVPNIAAAMPEYSADGTTWTIRLKPGTYFFRCDVHHDMTGTIVAK